ncbi:MAG: competence/damage-inducible protein A [Gaiellaceae bacterium]
MKRPSALVVVTGSELVRGDRRDRNGPFLARQLVSLGLEPKRIVIVGDRETELEAALREGLGVDLCVVSGGLGPTHDDRSVATVARVTGLALQVDPELEREIERVSRTIAARLGRPYADFAAGVRKQATLPEGALSLGLAGTAPGLVIQAAATAFVLLPGPPNELRGLWRAALESEPVRAVLERARPPVRRVLRFFGASESTVAQTLEDAGGERDGVETTVCARELEIHVDMLVDQRAEAASDDLAARLRESLGEYLFAEDERSIAEIVLELCRSRNLSLATAESSTGGLVAARLTAVPGASAVFVGGLVAYADEVKTSGLGVPEELLERHGAVSAETAAAMAAGARARFHADVAVAVTGVAGPGGGTPEKPVGLVHVCAAGPDGELAQRLQLPGDREAVRGRAAAVALHLVRRVLAQNRDGGA